MNDSDETHRLAEEALRQFGSHLWYWRSSSDWQDFLVANTVQFFDDHDCTIRQAAEALIKVYRQLVAADPGLLQANPW